MATPYNPLDRNASLQELSEAWALRYHYLYKVLRTLKIRPDRGEEGRTRYLTIAQQQQLADVLSARVPRPMDLERRSAEELHADLDRLSQSYERLSQAYEVVAGLAQTY